MIMINMLNLTDIKLLNQCNRWLMVHSSLTPTTDAFGGVISVFGSSFMMRIDPLTHELPIRIIYLF